MDFRKRSKQHGLGCRFLLERKERISIEDRGDLYIKNTQTAVRELFRRRPPIQSNSESSSQEETQLLKTRLQVDVLHKKIENEIGKLKKFRDCFLKVKKEKQKKAPPKASEKHLTWGEKLLNKEDGRTSRKGPSVSNRQELQNVATSSPDAEIDSKPFFHTMGVVSTSKTNIGAKLNSKTKPAVVENPEQQTQRFRRICGGCIFGHCNGFAMPSSVYKKDYGHPLGAGCNCRLSRCPHCNPYNCCCCDMPGAVPVPYSPNPCYQYPLGALNQQMPQYDDIYCCCPRQMYSRRKTDLNTDEICRNRTHLSRSPSPNPTHKLAEKEKGKSNPKTNSLKKNIKKEKDNILRVSLKKQEESMPVKEEIIIKEYFPAKPPDNDQEKMRMHREYMEMYKQEQDKTAGMESRLNLCDLENRPTYTKLPTEQIKLEDSRASFIEEKNSYENLQEGPAAGCSQYQQTVPNVPCPCQEEPPRPKTTVVSKNSLESQVREQDTFQKRTMSVRRNQVNKSNRLTDRVISSPDPNGKDRNVNRSPSPSRSKPSSSIIPPNNPLTPGFEQQVSSSTRITNQTDIQKGATDSPQASPARERDDQVTVPLDSKNSSVLREFSETDSEKLNATQSYKTIESDPSICSLRTGFVNDNSLTPDCEYGTARTPSNANFPMMDSTYIPAPDTTISSQQYIPLHEMMINCLQTDQQTIWHNPSVESVNEIYAECNCTSSSHKVSSPMCSGRTSSSRSLNDRNQLDLQRSSERTEYSSFPECPDLNRNALGNTETKFDPSVEDLSQLPDHSPVFDDTFLECPDWNTTCEGNTEIQYEEPLSQLQDQSPNFNETLTCEDPGIPDFSLCHDSQNVSQETSILKNCSPSGPSIIRTENSSFNSTLYQKRTRSVTFEDECDLKGRSNCCRSVIDWEEVHKRVNRMQEQQQMPEETNYSDNDDLMDSFRSSSTADTEFTCNESNYEEDCVTGNESRSDRGNEGIPPFNGCPCMYNEYLKLAALCRLPTRLE